MIQFCDMDVYTTYEDTINRGELFSFFCKKGNSTKIVLVLDNENNFSGIITYDLLLKRQNDFIQREKVVLDEKIWEKAKKLFNQNKDIIYLPVFNEKNELIYFSYNYVDEIYDKKMDLLFSQIEKNKEDLFIKEIYPNVQAVCIHGFNEWAYRMYMILKNKGISVITVGVLWEEFGIVNSSKLSEYPNYSIMNIYAEGTELVNVEKDRNSKNRFKRCTAFDFLINIGKINNIYIKNIIKQRAIEENKKWYTCNIPTFDELNNYTLEEFYRNKIGLYLLNDKLNYNDKMVKEQFFAVYGMTHKEMVDRLNKEADNKNNLNILEFEDMDIIGKRYGTGSQKIYIVGPCIVNGFKTLEKSQFVNLLFKTIEKKYSKKCTIITVPLAQDDFKTAELALEKLLEDEDGIVILMDEITKYYNKYNNVLNNVTIDLNLVDVFNNRPHTESWFANIPIHTNGKGNKAVAKEVFNQLLKPVLDTLEIVETDKELSKDSIPMTLKEKEELDKYIETIKENGFNTKVNDRVGAIVMNCNPFTKGHLYLIQKARKQVDYLYIFVVEENRSFFPFEERFELVKKGVAEFDNVKVFPSGKFIISCRTFPAYFTKDEIQDITIDASLDIKIFAEYIASALNINVRFVGEEPLDKITNQYNREMEKSLKKYNIDFIEIKRKKSDEEVISASRVRKLLKNGYSREIEKIVPSCTYEYLVLKYNRNVLL